MIGYEQALAVCRTDPEAAARLLCEFARELDQLKAIDKALLFDGKSIGGLFWLVKKYLASILHRKAGAGDAVG